MIDDRAQAFGGKKGIREQLALPESFFGECRRKARAGRLPLKQMCKVIELLGGKPGVWLYCAAQRVDDDLPDLVRVPPRVEDLPVGNMARDVLQRLDRAD